jgi:GDP-L-fucose synthase
MKILVTGGAGMVGSAFDKCESSHEIIKLRSQDCDLTDRSSCFEMINSQKEAGVDAVIHLAARVGGVKGNSDMLADFFSDNIRINTNVLDACTKHKIPKVLSLLSTCIYPDNARHPLTSDQIHDGFPHSSNFGYAFAKRMLDVHSRAIRSQHGLNYVTAVPNNMYGPHDNFDIVNGHVIPSIIMKIWEAKLKNTSAKLWGDGSSLREFTFSDVIAQRLLFLIENYEGVEPINIGRSGEISILDLATMICRKIDYDESLIEWDKDSQLGQFRKPSDNSKLFDLGWEGTFTELQDGVSKTIDWFKEHYPNVRGIIR